MGIPLELRISIYEQLYRKRLYRWDCAKPRRNRHGRYPGAVKTDEKPLPAMLLVNEQIRTHYQKKLGSLWPILSAEFETVYAFHSDDTTFSRSSGHPQLVKHATIYVKLERLHHTIAWRDIEKLAECIKYRASYLQSIRDVLRHTFPSVTERAVATRQFACSSEQRDIGMENLLDYSKYALEGFPLMQVGRGHSIETSFAVTESEGYGLDRELHYVRSIAALFYAHDSDVDKDWPPQVDPQYDDDVFEPGELSPEVIDICVDKLTRCWIEP